MLSQYGESRPNSGWDWFAGLGHPNKFQWVSRFGFVNAPTSLNGGQPNFAWCLAVSWAGTLYIHFREILPPTVFCQLQKSMRPNLAFSYIDSVTTAHSSSGRQPNFAAFSRRRITLGIGPQCSAVFFRNLFIAISASCLKTTSEYFVAYIVHIVLAVVLCRTAWRRPQCTWICLKQKLRGFPSFSRVNPLFSNLSDHIDATSVISVDEVSKFGENTSLSAKWTARESTDHNSALFPPKLCDDVVSRDPRDAGVTGCVCS